MTSGALGGPLVDAYWDAMAEGRYVVPECGACETSFFPPRVACPYCLSESVDLRNSDGRGRVYSYSVVHVDYHPDWGGRTPYVNAFVDLDDGPIVFTNLVGCDPGDVEVGTPVEVCFDDSLEEPRLPLFTPFEE